MSDVQIISRNTTLLSPLNITATGPPRSGYPARFFGNFTPAVWCTTSAGGPSPRITLSFNQLVLISGFIPGGFASTTGGFREYVTNFNLQYSTDLDSSNFSSPQVNQIYVISIATQYIAVRCYCLPALCRSLQSVMSWTSLWS